MKALHHPKIWYKGVTLRQFMNVLIDNYQATREERAVVKKRIKEPWDPNQHIKKSFEHIRTYLQTFAEMKNAVPYPAEDFLEEGYMDI